MSGTDPSPTPVAALPMYDWPELRPATDAFWAAFRDLARARGIAAPDGLDRGRPAGEVWTDGALVLSQTCGLPYRTQLRDHVTLLGAPDYGLEGCPPGHYCSLLVARRGDPRRGLEAFAGAPFAFNERMSQSGHAALMQAPGAERLGAGVETGAHRASIRAVAEGRADLAAIDAVAWRLAERFEPAAAELRVVGRTRPGPGLPMITAKGHDAALYARLVAAAIAAADGAVRAALGIRGFVRLAPADYLSA